MTVPLICKKFIVTLWLGQFALLEFQNGRTLIDDPESFLWWGPVLTKCVLMYTLFLHKTVQRPVASAPIHVFLCRVSHHDASVINKSPVAGLPVRLPQPARTCHWDTCAVWPAHMWVSSQDFWVKVSSISGCATKCLQSFTIQTLTAALTCLPPCSPSNRTELHAG